MQTIYDFIGRQHHWLRDTSLGQSKIDPVIRPWVTDKGSLTAALCALSGDQFQVNVLKQGIAIPYWHEQKKLKRPFDRAAMIREVELHIFGEAVVYARSIVPLALVSNGKNGLANLGRTPLGHLLFKDGKIRVSKREFAKVNFHGRQITARRTPYDYQGSSILVSEFFLPAFDKRLD